MHLCDMHVYGARNEETVLATLRRAATGCMGTDAWLPDLCIAGVEYEICSEEDPMANA